MNLFSVIEPIYFTSSPTFTGAVVKLCNLQSAEARFPTCSASSLLLKSALLEFSASAIEVMDDMELFEEDVLESRSTEGADQEPDFDDSDSDDGSTAHYQMVRPSIGVYCAI